MIWYKFERHNGQFMALFFDGGMQGNNIIDIITCGDMTTLKQHIATEPRLAIHVRKFDWTK